MLWLINKTSKLMFVEKMELPTSMNALLNAMILMCNLKVDVLLTNVSDIGTQSALRWELLLTSAKLDTLELRLFLQESAEKDFTLET